MALLDPTAISDPDDYTPVDYRDKGLVIRRFKKDIKHQVTGDKERRTIRLTPQASPAEEAAYRALLAIRFTQGVCTGAGDSRSCNAWPCKRPSSPARLPP